MISFNIAGGTRPRKTIRDSISSNASQSGATTKKMRRRMIGCEYAQLNFVDAVQGGHAVSVVQWLHFDNCGKMKLGRAGQGFGGQAP